MRAKLCTGLILLALVHPSVHADATLTYRLAPAAGDATTLRIATTRFFARIESSAAPDGWWLFQAGKFFPLFRVDDKMQTWTRLTPEVTPRLGPMSRTGSAAGAETADAPKEQVAETADVAPEQPAAPAAELEPMAEQKASAPKPARASTEPKFAPTAQMDEVAGVRCRVVSELRDGAPAVEHCMANKAALGITEREVRSLARTFAMAREQGFGWLGSATADEAFVSVRSRALDGGATLVLESVSTAALPEGHLRVPEAYREVPWAPEPTMTGGTPAPQADAPQPGEGETR